MAAKGSIYIPQGLGGSRGRETVGASCVTAQEMTEVQPNNNIHPGCTYFSINTLQHTAIVHSLNPEEIKAVTQSGYQLPWRDAEGSPEPQHLRREVITHMPGIDTTPDSPFSVAAFKRSGHEQTPANPFVKSSSLLTVPVSERGKGSGAKALTVLNVTATRA